MASYWGAPRRCSYLPDVNLGLESYSRSRLFLQREIITKPVAEVFTYSGNHVLRIQDLLTMSRSDMVGAHAEIAILYGDIEIDRVSSPARPTLEEKVVSESTRAYPG